MIKNLEGTDTKIVELGNGTTFIGQLISGDSTLSSGIVFSNHSDGLHGDEVIIEITDIKGVAAYLKGAVELLKSWEIEGAEEPINNLLNSLNPILNPGNTK